MSKKARRVFVGQILDKQAAVKTYNEANEGLLYNNQDLEIRAQIEGVDREVVTDTATQVLTNKTFESPMVNSASINNPLVTNGTFANSVLNNATINSASINVPVLSGGTLSLTTLESSAVNACVLSGNTIDVDVNTLSNVELDNFKAGVLLTTTVSVSINDANFFSAKAIKDYADGLNSVTSGALTDHLNDTIGAHAASAISNVPSGNLAATDVQSALNELQSDVDSRILSSEKGAISGVCPLGADQKVSATYLPSYVDDVLEYADLAAFPVTGESGKIYIALDTNLTYRWSGTVYAGISSSIALGETSTTAYRGDRGATAYSHTLNSTGVHGVTGSVVGTSDTQVLTNKDIDGGTAANTRRITVPQDTLANITSLTRKEGTVLYGNDTNKLYVDDGSTLTAVGAGGVGNPGVYSLLKSDEDSTAWTTGNNSTFLGGGSIAGTFTQQNGTTPLNGTYSYSYAMVSGSLNDYATSSVQAVPLRSRGVTNRTNLVYTYDGNDNDIKWIVYDVTNSTIVTPSTAYVVTSSVGKQVELIYDLPVTCTQVRFGFQVLVANNTKVLKFDDVQMSDEPFTTANLVIREVSGFSGPQNSTNVPNNGTTGLKFLLSNFSNSNNQCFNLTNDANRTYIKVIKNGDLTINGNFIQAGGVIVSLYKTGGGIVASNSVPSANDIGKGFNYTVKVSSGDQYYFAINTSILSNTSEYFALSFTHTAISSNIIQTWQDGTEWTAYTPTFTSLGTPSSVAFAWKRDGGDLLIQGKFTSGTGASSEARISFPSSLVSSSSIVGLVPSGQAASNQVAAGYFNTITLMRPSVSYIMLGRQTSGVEATSAANGDGYNGNIVTIQARIPIQGWSSSPTILALPSATQTDYYLEAAGNAGQSITADVTDIPFIAVTNNNLTWDGSGFTAPISGNYKTDGMIYLSSSLAPTISIYVNGSRIKLMSYAASGARGQPFSGEIYLIAGQRLSIRSDTTATLTNAAHVHHISITRLNGKNDSVFVANYQPDYQYNLTVTGSGWTTIRAVGVPYKTGDGSYRMKGNIYGSVTGTSGTISISGVTFKSIADQAVTLTDNASGGSIVDYCWADKNASTISWGFSVSAGGGKAFSFDVELDSKPSFATFLP